MTDALQWAINLLTPDIARLAGGIMVMVLIIEFLFRFKRWMK